MAVKHNNANYNRRGGASFEIGRSYRDGELKHVVTIRCAKCDRVEDMVWNTGHNPDFVKRRALSMGWLFDPFQRSACVCPNCHKRGAKAVAQSLPPTPPPIQAKNVVDLKSERPTSTRALTPDEKTKVRRALDAHFDDATGRYIEGYTDKQVGAELDLPWAAVAQYREFAYGPIREDARVVAIQAEMAFLRSEISDMRDTHAAMAHLIKRFESWQNRFAALETKVKGL